VPKRLSEKQKLALIDSFKDGKTISELAEIYNCTKMTISRHLKKGIDEATFNNYKKNNKKKFTLENEKQLNYLTNKNKVEEENFRESNHFIDSSYVEVIPLNIEIDNHNQKDLTSISLSEINLPKIVYVLVDKNIELETKLLIEYPDWQFLSQKELNRKTIEIFFDIKAAKKVCKKDQKVIKLPNTDVFKLVAPLLISKGITRIVSPEQLIAF
tara:strand:+ start:10 stop:648 length:639 start_codon:yes stop_codon:yes gene_type:complete